MLQAQDRRSNLTRLQSQLRRATCSLPKEHSGDAQQSSKLGASHETQLIVCLCREKFQVPKARETQMLPTCTATHETAVCWIMYHTVTVALF